MDKISLDRITINEKSLIIDALGIIEEGALQIALVVNEKGELVGTVTDGDIRRGIINGKSLKSEINEIMYKEYLHIEEETAAEEIALGIMKNRNISQIPVLDKNKRLVNLYTLKNILQKPDIKTIAVIMAGGEGKRLRPYTHNCPKPMLKLGNKPILEILIRNCIAHGVKNYYISVNYLKSQIIDYFGYGEKWGIKINYLEEEKAMGTAGSLKLLPSKIKENLLIINGDILTKLNIQKLIEFQIDAEAKGSICVVENRTSIPYGVVKSKGIELESIEEKPTLIHMVNAGIYTISPEILKIIPKEIEYLDMPELMMMASRIGMKITTYPIHEYWLDIGRHETLNQARVDWE